MSSLFSRLGRGRTKEEEAKERAEVPPEELKELREALEKAAALKQALEKQQSSENPAYSLSIEGLLLWLEVKGVGSAIGRMTGRLNYLLGGIAIGVPLMTGLLIAVLVAVL